SRRAELAPLPLALLHHLSRASSALRAQAKLAPSPGIVGTVRLAPRRAELAPLLLALLHHRAQQARRYERNPNLRRAPGLSEPFDSHPVERSLLRCSSPFCTTEPSKLGSTSAGQTCDEPRDCRNRSTRTP